MPSPASFRSLIAALLFNAAMPFLTAADGAVASHPAITPSYIVVGFAGGFVRHDNLHHGPVQLAHRMQSELPTGATIQVFENRHRRAAYQSIVRMLDSNHDGVLSAAEKAQARIILFGHSWGASAVVMLSQELDRAGIPVLLTVQVDSVTKPWQRDGVIPANVTEAANFYQPHGLLHGRSEIRAADDSKTQILGNFRFDYQKTPVRCEGTSWFDRTFTPSHMQSQCDPRLWTLVEELVRKHVGSQTPAVAAVATP